MFLRDMRGSRLGADGRRSNVNVAGCGRRVSIICLGNAMPLTYCVL